MEDFINFYYTDGSHFVGRIRITNSELIIYKKSFWTLFFGFVGDALIRGKEFSRIQLNEIANIKKDKYKRRKDACYITLRNGETYIIAFSYPQETFDYLSYRIKIAAKNKIEQ